MLWMVKTLFVPPKHALSHAYAVCSSSGANAVCQSFAWTICGANPMRWQHSNAARVSMR
jgi:hypothetical protein